VRIILVLIGLATWMTGCSAYRMEGIVVEGPTPAMVLVSENDPRLQSHGMPNAAIELTLDPSSMSPKQLATDITDQSGRFSIPVEAMGAGSWQEYNLGVLCRLKGYVDMWQTMKLPPRNRKLLIIMSPGQGGHRPPSDILNETLRMKDELLK